MQGVRPWDVLFDGRRTVCAAILILCPLDLFPLLP